VAIPYNPTWQAVLHPAAGTTFFAAGRPATEAALCAELGRATYLGFECGEAGRRAAEAVLAAAGFTANRFFSAGGTECFLAGDAANDLTVLAFRGTAGLRDWITDGLAWRRRWPAGGAVHHGFARALAAVWPQVLPHLGPRPGRLLYTGHSLGGALATLAASLVPPDILYTFGSPRVGDARFVETIAAVPCVRTVDCCDMVCNLPPAWLGYAHAGNEHYADRDGRVRRDLSADGIRADQAAARADYRRQLAWKAGNVWWRRLADHAPVNYVSALTGRG